jgi:YVTN family beta-propeller protein
VQAANGTLPNATQAVSLNIASAPTAPGAPTIGTATPGNTQATVTFTAPASNGGSEIISYTATSNPSNINGTCTAPCTSITVSGLTNGTAYTFTVTATNAIGTSTASAASNSVTPAFNTLLAGTRPIAIAVNTVTNKVYVANQDSNNVTVIDGATNTTTTVAAGSNPSAIAVNSVTNKVYVANQDSNNVTVIDAVSNTVIATVAAGTGPYAIAVNSVTNKVYVAN